MRGEIRELCLNPKKFLRHLLVPLISLILLISWIILSSYVKSVINPNPPQELKAVSAFRFLKVSDLTEVFYKIISDPSLALIAFQFEMHKKILYIILTFAPSCFLALLSPIALLPVFLWLLLASLSNWGPYYSLGFQYTAFTLPFVIIATIDAMKVFYYENFNRRNKGIIVRRLSTMMLLVGLILSIFLSPLSFVHKVGDHSFCRDYGISIPSMMNEKIREIISKIPEEVLVLTTPKIQPHLSTNPNVYTLPPMNQPSPRLFESTVKYLKGIKFEYILITSFWNKEEARLIYSEFIKSSGEYGLLIKAPGIELYRRGYKDLPEKISVKFSYKELNLPEHSRVLDDPSSQSGKVIALQDSSESERTAWFGPYITLLPGNYTVKFRIKFNNVQEGRIIDLDIYSGSKGRISLYSVDSREVKPFMWHEFSISFSIEDRVEDIEFRGLNVRSDVSVYLDYVEVIPE
jgi:hypothetical protein